MTAQAAVTPEQILQMGFGFWTSKTLLSAVELGVFTELAKGPLDAETLRTRLHLHPRAARDFFDALLALGLLERQDGRYRNAAASEAFLDRAKPSYVGGLLEMANARLYGFWGALTEALRTGQPQNEAKSGESFFHKLYQDPERLKGFAKAMTAVSYGPAMAIAAKFPWDRYKTFADVGTAEGGLPVHLARAHPHLTGIGFDLPPVQPVFEAFVASHGLGDRLSFRGGDFLIDALPKAEVLVMGHILHGFGLADKLALLKRVHETLPAGGAVIVYDSIIDDERRENAFGLLMSLNMLIETSAGFDYTGADCIGWMREAGFRDMRVEHLAGPASMVVGFK
jgi:O-methyltransferase domain/Dimerisation domain